MIPLNGDMYNTTGRLMEEEGIRELDLRVHKLSVQ